MSTKHTANVAFNASLRSLLSMMERKARDDTTEAMVLEAQNMIKMANAISHEELITSSIPYFMKYNTQITNRDEAYFLDVTVTTVSDLRARNDAKGQTMALLIDVIKTMYLNSNATDRNRAYDLLRSLRDEALNYAAAIAK